MRRFIIAGFLALAALLAFNCALAAAPANQVERGVGVTLIPAEDWGKTYPDVYESYMANSENDEVVEYPEQYPMLATLYEGNAFSTYYGSARGHYYTVQDVQATGRPHKLANCFTCKTADFTKMTIEQGDSAYSMEFDDALAQINGDLGCYTCHAEDPANGITVTHTYLIDALGEDFDSVPGATASCAQCHVEYYFDPETKATSLPYTGAASRNPDDMYAFYEAMHYVDYVNPRTGTELLKTQHPEFETYTGEGSKHAAMFTCADCHMERLENANGEKYLSHEWVSPLDSETIQATCAACHEDLTSFVHGIQEGMEARTIEVGNRLAGLIDKLAEAVESGEYTDEELDAIRALHRKSQWYWDFVFVENSEGAHNSALDNSCLDKADALIDEALGLFKS